MPKRGLELGQVVVTKNAWAEITANTGSDKEAVVALAGLLDKYRDYEWGDLDPEDRLANDRAVKLGGRTLGSYSTGLVTNGKIWIITEADRSVTTVLLPEDY